ncbi:hypothetical protein AAZX31_09G109600 [Glycine max]|uniref:Uncharacterized protein n=1 Tax=Glycine max TaxID=3847 RepID=K7LDD1_SOYBN|nr:hypothetical protein JHK86_024933 [Glycine max]KAG5133632.1 hypothetical protein JHK82_024820 [Glycine max]KAH1042634.1 hypothetical protein GYH30_024772 [Glycine max]KRH38206.1 hypothetical protein GLYMA_09G118200v4 [Glycine max]
MEVWFLLVKLLSFENIPAAISCSYSFRRRFENKREAHEAVYAMCCNVEQAWGRVRLVRMHGPKFSTITVTVS